MEALQERQGEIAVEMALVEFVEDDGVDAFERWIGQEAACEDALGDKSQTRVRPGPLFETYLIADGSANLFVQFPGDSSRRQACRDPPRLEHDNVAADQTQKGQWDAGGRSASQEPVNDV